MRNKNRIPTITEERVKEKLQQKQEHYDLQSELSNQRSEQRYNENLNIYAPIDDFSTPFRMTDNANMIKIIWQLKLRTTLLHNVINQILYKWPEDHSTILNIVDKNKNKFEAENSKEIMDLIDSNNISYKEVIKSSIFDLPNKPYPSRSRSSKLGV